MAPTPSFQPTRTDLRLARTPELTAEKYRVLMNDHICLVFANLRSQFVISGAD